jgi:pimeloyl-ACP methyl ester carboxylesterase
MPRTLYFHGAGDMIVHVSQSEYFQRNIKNFRLEIFKNCGHAPHLSDAERIKKIIVEEIGS